MSTRKLSNREPFEFLVTGTYINARLLLSTDTFMSLVLFCFVVVNLLTDLGITGHSWDLAPSGRPLWRVCCTQML